MDVSVYICVVKLMVKSYMRLVNHEVKGIEGSAVKHVSLVLNDVIFRGIFPFFKV